MTDAAVRPFERADEAAVRRICLENGRLPMGTRPEDWIFEDYWTRYYTRIEPEHAWVAVKDGTVAGYLTAAFDTRRFERAMKRRILPALLLKSAFTGALAHAASRLFILKRIALWSNPEPEPAGLLEKFPAHLHVNLAEGHRGGGLGAALVERCVDEARRAGLPGIHLKTAAGNAAACRFFERMGFAEIGRQFPFRKIDPALKDLAVAVYGRAL